MSEKNDDGWYHGRSENPARRFSAEVTDCSSWEPDIPADQWTHGRSMSLTQRHMVEITDCSGWDRLPAVWLELRIPVDARSDAAAVEAATVRLIHAAAAAAPELGLLYDGSRSGVEGREVVIALTPTNPVGAEDRLAEIARTIAAGQAAAARWRKAG